VIGSTTKWKAEEFSLGLMAEFMMENTEMTKRRATAFLNGLTVDATEECGKMDFSTEKESMQQPTDKKKKVNGKKENELSGSL